VADDGSVALTSLPIPGTGATDSDRGKRAWLLPAGSKELRPLLQEPAMVAQLHASGKWFAYVTPPQEGLYIREILADGETGRRFTVDTAGYEPLWSVDGATLYYRKGSRLLAASFRDGTVGEPRVVLENFSPSGITNDRSNYDVGADGRVLFGVRMGAGSTGARPGEDAPVRVVVNWFSELERLVPSPGSRNW